METLKKRSYKSLSIRCCFPPHSTHLSRLQNILVVCGFWLTVAWHVMPTFYSSLPRASEGIPLAPYHHTGCCGTLLRRTWVFSTLFLGAELLVRQYICPGTTLVVPVYSPKHGEFPGSRLRARCCLFFLLTSNTRRSCFQALAHWLDTRWDLAALTSNPLLMDLVIFYVFSTFCLSSPCELPPQVLCLLVYGDFLS